MNANELRDRIAVADAIMRERLARETGNWAEEAACFHPESIVDVSWLRAAAPSLLKRGKEPCNGHRKF